MISQKLLWKGVLLTMLLIACGGGDSEETIPEPQPSGTDTPTPTTPLSLKLKASCSDKQFVTGDKVGVYMVYDAFKTAGNYLDNMLLNYENSNWALAHTAEWKDQNAPASFYAYAPYSKDIIDPHSYTFSVNSDQSTIERQNSSDLLWGCLVEQNPTSKTLTLPLKRLMARLSIKVEAGENVTKQDLEGDQLVVRINGVQTQATVNLGNGELNAFGAISNITPFREQTQLFSAIIVPQQVSNVEFVMINWCGKVYSLTQTMIFESGKQYTLTVTVKQTAGTMNIGIGQWEIIEEDYGGTVS